MAPTLSDIPYPAFGSTAYTRDNQKPGVKQGLHRTGVFVGHKGPDSVAVYLPHDQSVIHRNASGVRFNSDFDNFDPVARDRALIRGDPPHLPGAPSPTSSTTPIITKDPVYAANDPTLTIGHLHCADNTPLPCLLNAINATTVCLATRSSYDTNNIHSNSPDLYSCTAIEENLSLMMRNLLTYQTDSRQTMHLRAAGSHFAFSVVEPHGDPTQTT